MKMRWIPILLGLLVSLPSQASVGNLQPLSPVEFSPQGGGSFSVVASDNGWFLVDGRRVNPQGELVDELPLAGVFGRAAGWEDGWLLFEERIGEILVRHLGTSGGPVVVARFPSVGGSLIEVETGHGQIVLVEQRLDRPGDVTTWVTVRTLDRVTRIQRFPTMTNPAVATTRDGFRLVAHHLGPTTVLHLWELDASGKPLQYKQYDAQTRISDELDIVASGNSTLVVAPFITRTRLDVVSENLEIVGTSILTHPTGARVTAVLPLRAGFFVAYSTGSGASEQARAKIIARDGTELADVAAEPIAGADAHGDEYFVLRPWRDGAIAKGDPRAIATSPIRIVRGTYQSYTLAETVVSGDVTLAIFSGDRLMMRRVDAMAQPIAAEPIEAPSTAVAAVPGGFAFLWRDGERLLMRRLHARGYWMDPDPIELLRATGVVSADIAANDANLVITWTTARAIHWRTFSFAGDPERAQSSADLPSYPDEDFGAWPLVDAYSSGSGHLLVVNHHFECRITCVYPRVPVHAIALDSSGAPRGPITIIGPDARADAATVLADGSWLLSVAHQGFVRLSSNGALVSVDPFPAGVESFIDLKAAGAGWIASDHQARVYEFDSSAHPRTLKWVSTAPDHYTMLGTTDLVVFSRPAEELRTGSRAPSRVYAGILSNPPGDVSITLIRAWRNENRTSAEVELRNDSDRSMSVTLQVLPLQYDWNRAVEVMLPAGAIQRIVVAPSGHRLFGLEARAEIEDRNPLDNVVMITEDDIAEPRRRGLRR